MLGKADPKVYEALSTEQRDYLRSVLLALCDMTEDDRARAIAALGADVLELLAACGPILNRYIPHDPSGNFKQWALLSQPLSEVRELFYGGAAGGGKSDGLLMAALQYADVPGYAAIILRRTFQDLSLPGSLMDRAEAWLSGTDATYSATLKRWTFPSGAILQFGYVEHVGDEQRYQSAEFQFIGWDEASQIPERQIDFINSRCRKPNASKPGAERLAAVPLRIRLASNPGGISHAYIKRRYIDLHSSKGLPEDTAVIRSTLEDNPYIDRESYEKMLASIADPIDRARLRAGDWEVMESGGLFRRDWIRYISEAPAELRPGATDRGRARIIRSWDLAGSPVTPQRRDPDWTSGALIGYLDGVWYLLDVQRLRDTPGAVERLVAETALLDGRATPIRIEQEPGQSGKSQIAHYKRSVLPGYSVEGVPASGSKEVRAAPIASAMEAGNFYIVTDYYSTGKVAGWIRPVVENLGLFPEGKKDDIDAIAGAFDSLSPKPKSHGRRPVPLGLPSVASADIPAPVAPSSAR